MTESRLRPAIVDKIVSGGQTGADRGGLNAAIKLGIPHGGWCPKGRKAEDGTIPPRYQLQETGSTNYQSRTRRNVLDSDGTVIFTRGKLEGGSLLTARIAREAGKPNLHLDLRDIGSRRVQSALDLRTWIGENKIRTLNVAGARESKVHGVQHAVARFLCDALGGVVYPVEEERIGPDGPVGFSTGPDEVPYGKPIPSEKKKKA